MKVVIFCGGFGVRMGEATRRIPKPMIEIGGRPILWHIMRYYASWGHNDFILCLGYKSEVVKEYFLSYNGALFNDFVLERNGSGTKLDSSPRSRQVAYHLRQHGARRDDRGTAEGRRPVSRRRRGVPRDVRRRPHRRALPEMIDRSESRKIAMFLRSAPSSTRTSSRPTTPDGRARRGHEPLGHPHQRRVLRVPARDPRSDRAGRRARRGDVRAPDRAGELVAYPYEGFLGPMDTIKDRQRLEIPPRVGAGAVAEVDSRQEEGTSAGRRTC